MTQSNRIAGYLVLGLAALFAGLLAGRPEAAVVAAPFLLLAAYALVTARTPRLEVGLEWERERAVEGDRIRGRVAVAADEPVAAGRVTIPLPAGLRLLTAPAALAFSLPRGGRWEAEIEVHCRRWGGYRAGWVVVSGSDRLGLRAFSETHDLRSPLRVYPAAERLRRALPPRRTQSLAGNRVAPQQGEGIEFAEIRAFVPGDRVRRVNWRVTARRGGLHVNEMHLERNADLVLFLDTFVELREAGVSTLDLTVRGATAILEHHLAGRDRVGLLGFGGTLRWLRPGMGQVQLYRLVDSLIDTEVVPSYAWKGVEVIPPRVLPPGAVVVALSPLLDERSLAALADLRARGHDVVIVEVVAEAFVTPGRSEADRLAYRLWRLERDALRARFAQLGVAVASWRPEEPLAAALERTQAFRRSARLVRA